MATYLKVNLTQTIENFFSDVKVGVDSMTANDPYFLAIVAGAISVYALSGILSAKYGSKCNRCCKSMAYLYSTCVLVGTATIVVGSLIRFQEQGLFLKNLKAAGLTVQDCMEKCNRFYQGNKIVLPCPKPCYPMFADKPWLLSYS